MTLHRRHRLWVRLVMAACAAALFVLGYHWGNSYRQRKPDPTRIDGVMLQGEHRPMADATHQTPAETP